MRNLKRVLSLTLASVMLLGMMVIGASAAEVKKIDFADADSIEYTEAVDVMVALEVLQGSGKNFNPKDILTREQAAKIICHMILGAENAAKLSTNEVVFNDVAAGRWSAGYIAYCARLGILSGVGGGNFAPDGQLTGVQFGKMLLVALGYDPKIQKYTGSNWAISVGKDMIEAGIDVKGTLLTAPLTREQAAQMAFQALEADLVYYDFNLQGYLTGVQTPENVTWGSGEKKVNYDGKDDGIKQFCEKYFPDLKKSDTTDDFGRPGVEWKLKSNSIDKYVEDSPVLTYTTSVKEKDIFKDLGVTGRRESGAYYVVMDKVWQDGVEVATAKAIASTGGEGIAQTSADYYDDAKVNYYTADTTNSDVYGRNDSVIISKGDDGNSNTHGSGEGVTLEIYETEHDNHYIMVITQEYLAKVTSVTKADADKGIERSVKLTSNAWEGSKTFETEDFAKDDYLLVTVADGEVKTAKLAEKIEDVAVTGYKGTNGTPKHTDTVTADGTTYKYSQLVDAVTDRNNFTMSGGASYTFYLDSCGNVIRGEQYEKGAGNYIYVADASSQEGNTVVGQYYDVLYITLDGTKTVVKSKDNLSSAKNKWYTVTEDDDNEGYMKFTAVPTTLTNGVKADNAAALGTSSDNAKQILSKTQATVAAGVVANNNTTFVLKTGGSPDKWEAYQGLSNVPGYEIAVGSEKTVAAVIKNGYAVAIYLDTTGFTNVDSGSTDVIYVLSGTSTDVRRDEVNNVSYKVYNAIVNGEPTTIKATESATINAGLVTINGYSSKGGYVTGTTAVSGDKYVKDELLKNAAGKVTFEAGTLTIGEDKATVAAVKAKYTIDFTGKVQTDVNGKTVADTTITWDTDLAATMNSLASEISEESVWTATYDNGILTLEAQTAGALGSTGAPTAAPTTTATGVTVVKAQDGADEVAAVTAGVYTVADNAVVYTIKGTSLNDVTNGTADDLVGESVQGTFYIIYKSTSEKVVAEIYFAKA